MIINMDDGANALFIGNPQVVCSKHGEHDAQSMVLFDKDQYLFCPYCWGEWLRDTFPVTPGPKEGE